MTDDAPDAELVDRRSSAGDITRLVTAVEEMGQAIDALNTEVSKERRSRRRRSVATWLAAAAVVIASVITVSVEVDLQSISSSNHSLQESNHSILQNVLSVTSPQAQAKSQAKSATLITEILQCIPAYTAHDLNPRIAVPATCPPLPPSTAPKK